MPKVHMIGNAHLDPVWLWTWQDGFSEVLATFRSALDRMNEDENYAMFSLTDEDKKKDIIVVMMLNL